jgi:hypothetical protein
MSLIGRNCARGKTRVLLAQSDPNKAHVRPEASPRGYPAFAERFLMHPTSEGRSTTRGGCDCRRQLRRASEQSVAERRLTAPVVDPFDNPGPAGRLKARTPTYSGVPAFSCYSATGGIAGGGPPIAAARSAGRKVSRPGRMPPMGVPVTVELRVTPGPKRLLPSTNAV